MVIDLEERTGAVCEALNEVQNIFNIALAETVTIDQRTSHRITLILEPPFNTVTMDHLSSEYKRKVREFRREVERFKERVSGIKGFITATSSAVVDEKANFERQETSTIRYGSIDFTTIRDWLARTYVKQFEDRFDFSRVIVSSSAEGRFIRYIFPKKGVFEATVSHLDVPTALAQISSVFHNLKYNILLSRLSRSKGDTPAQEKSIYVAVCEPLEALSPITDHGQYYSNIAAKISQRLDECKAGYQFVLANGRVSSGAKIDRVAYPYRHGIDPGSMEILAPPDLRPYLDHYRLPANKRSVFISYRKGLRTSSEGEALVNTVISKIEAAGAAVYDGFSLPDVLKNDDAADIRARMWMASAAVFFAIKDEEGGLSANQLVEWAFMYGQGKPWAVIVRTGEEQKLGHFMIPDRSFITFPDLRSPATIADIAERISKVMHIWFPEGVAVNKSST